MPFCLIGELKEMELASAKHAITATGKRLQHVIFTVENIISDIKKRKIEYSTKMFEYHWLFVKIRIWYPINDLMNQIN